MVFLSRNARRVGALLLTVLLLVVGCAPRASAPAASADVQLVAMSFVDATHGWVAARECAATGGDASGACRVQVYRTEDGGATWARAARFLLTPSDLSFADRQTGWLVGSIGNTCGTQTCPNAVMLSQDGGLTWDRVSTVSVDLQSVSAASASNAWTVGQLCSSHGDCGAVVVATASAGQTWQNLTLPISGHGFQVLRPASGLAIVGGMASDGAVLARSADGGATWRTIRPPCQGAADPLAFTDPHQGWLACVAPPGGPTDQVDVLHSADGGTTWTKVAGVSAGRDVASSPTPAGASSGGQGAALTFTSSQNGWLVSSSGEVLRSQDGGASWTGVLQSGEPLLSVKFTDAQHGWVMGTGSVWRTTDGGRTWVQVRIVGGSWPILPSPPKQPAIE